VDNMAAVTISDTLKLPSKINVMNLSKTPGEIKQLAVYSVVKRVLENLANVILIIDELPDFAPQRYRTPSKQMIGQAIRKGGAKGIWLWLSGQTMTGVDKQVLKQAMIWILGHQREINEAKRTLDQIPFKTGLKVNDIMTLPVGHFVVCTDEGAYITYIQPEGVSPDVARQVSLGQISVNSVVESLKKEKEDDDWMYKEKYEEQKRKRLEVEKEFTRQVERISDLKAKDKIEKARKKILAMNSTIQEEVSKKVTQIEADMIKKVRLLEERIGSQAEDLKLFDEFRSVMRRMIPGYAPPGFETGEGVPSEVSVTVEQPALILKKKTEPLELSQNTVDGRIAIAYAEGLLEMKWFTKKRLNTTLEQRFGKKEAYPNIQKPLTNMTAWGYFEFHMAGPRKEWRVKLAPKEARGKGLLKEVEA